MSPKALKVVLHFAELDSGQMTFKELSHAEDVLRDNYPASAGFELEPKDQMILDMPIYIPQVTIGDTARIKNPLIRVTAILTDSADHLWKEQRILAMRN